MKFAGDLFDTLGQPGVPADQFTLADIAAASTLDVSFTPPAIRARVTKGITQYDAMLSDVSPDVALWNATDAELEPAYAWWRELRKLDRVGPTKTSKLLARKRPKMLPIVDSVIRDAWGYPSDAWVALRAALQTPGLVTRIENELRPLGVELASTFATVGRWILDGLQPFEECSEGSRCSRFHGTPRGVMDVLQNLGRLSRYDMHAVEVEWR